jgi:hypothetical protein
VQQPQWGWQELSDERPNAIVIRSIENFDEVTLRLHDAGLDLAAQTETHKESFDVACVFRAIRGSLYLS